MNRDETAESFILRHYEGIFEQFNTRRRRRGFIVNGDHVETPWHFREAAKVSARHFSWSTAASAGFTSWEVRVFTSMKQRTSPSQPMRSISPRRRGER